MGKKRCDSELVNSSLSHLLSLNLLSFHIYTNYFPTTTCCSGVHVLRSIYFCDFICLFFCLLNTNSMPTLGDLAVNKAKIPAVVELHFSGGKDD